MRSGLLNPDRRVVYLLLIIALTIPLLKPFGMPIPISEDTRTAYAYIEGMDPGARVLLSIDYGPSVVAELQAQCIAFLRHLARKGIRTYVITTTPDGVPLAAAALTESFEAAGKREGIDYIYLGYVAGQEAGLAAMGDSLASVVEVQNKPIMEGIGKLSDFTLAIALRGDGVLMWVRQAYTKYNVPLLFSVTAVVAAGTVPYVQAGQAIASLTSNKCAAEYEVLGRLPGKAVATMDAQSSSHLLIIVLIMLGNVGYYLTKRPKAQEARP